MDETQNDSEFLRLGFPLPPEGDTRDNFTKAVCSAFGLTHEQLGLETKPVEDPSNPWNVTVGDILSSTTLNLGEAERVKHLYQWIPVGSKEQADALKRLVEQFGMSALNALESIVVNIPEPLAEIKRIIDAMQPYVEDPKEVKQRERQELKQIRYDPSMRKARGGKRKWKMK